MKENSLSISHVSKSFHIKNEVVQALSDISLDIKKGEFVSIIGSSGCGKSTLLKLIIGLDKATSGDIVLNDISENNDKKNHIGMVFQESRLYPWLSVEKNIEFGITENISKLEKRELINKQIELVGLRGFEKALPKQLSGGMQQRVSIARALVSEPDILLLDEPFGALDAITRMNMQTELLNIWKRDKKTMILVTHDIDEAIFLSDRIIVLTPRPGKVKDIITVDRHMMRNRSSDDFLAMRKKVYINFFGSMESDLEYYI
jgi:sulfonate transport system ATP-binding protein